MSERRHPKIEILTIALAAGALALIAYGKGLRLPFYADDLQQIPWVKEVPAGAYWYQLDPYGDWRPLRFMLLRAVYVATGTLSPMLLHAVNLAAHIGCGLLLGLLARRWHKNGWVVAALFVTFPFATNVVLWISAISYPLTTGLALASLLVYLRARERQSPSLHLVAVLFTVMAGLVYEGGVMAGVAVFWAELALGERPYSRWVVGHVAGSMAIFVAILTFSATVPTEFLTGLHPWYNVVALLQCIAYPFAFFVEWGARQVGANSLVLLTLLGTLTLLALAALNARLKQARLFLFSLGWVIMWSAIPLVTQPFNWFRDPTRAFYQSSAGIALLWGVTILGLARARPADGRRASITWRSGAAVILFLIALLPSFWFTRRVVGVHRMVGDLLWEAVDAAQTMTDTLVVNLPGRVTPKDRVYPLMHEGIIPIPPPTNGEIFVAAHTDALNGFRGRSLTHILPEVPYTVEPADLSLTLEDLRDASRVLIVNYTSTEMSLASAGSVRLSEAPAHALVTFYAPHGFPVVALEHATCHRTEAGEIILRLEWAALNSVDGFPTVFTHWFGPTGTLDAQADGSPLRGLYPLSFWQPGERVVDVRVLQVGDAREGTLSMGVWDPDAGTRWLAQDAEGHLLPDNAYYLPHCETVR